MIRAVHQADLLMYNGLDLEIGYLPVLIESSRNPKVQYGNAGNLDLSQFITPIQKPGPADRSMGDVHPLGNPHYHLSPRNISMVADGITKRLSALDGANADFYRANLSVFNRKLKDRIAQWAQIPLKGKRYIQYHQFFEYLAADFGFTIVGSVEEKPGIPPSAAHIERLIQETKTSRPDGILTTAYYGSKEIQFIAQKAGLKSVVIPPDVGATDTARDWFSLMDQILTALP
jgi:zinc/manganese transport system substrate-binding protein